MLLLIRKLKNIRRLNLGFSLVELLVVISIIGVLTAILMANFMGARDRAKDAQRIEDLNGMKNALRLYYNDHQSYPVGTGFTSVANFSAADQTELLKVIPGIAGVGFTYYQTDNGDSFQLCVGLDAGSGNDDVNSQVKCGSGVTGVCGLGIGNTADKLYVVCAQ